MNNKKINIVTINLNNKDGLERTIKSVIDQTYNYEFNYIVIDGGSTDGSVEVIEKYKSYIDYYVSEKDNGVYNAMNKAIDVCNGEYVLFINSGDYLHDDNVIEDIYNELDGTDIVYGALNVHGNTIEYVINYDYYVNKGLPHPATFIKVDLLRKNKFREDFKIISDWIFFFEEIYLNRTPYKKLSRVISDFFNNGLSSDANACIEEKSKYIKLLKDNDKFVSIAMCCIGRMENKYVKEFVEFYQRLGVDKFFIYDNNHGNEEHFEDVLKPYIKNGVVEIIDYRDRNVCQLSAYQDCYNKNGDIYEWICFFDFDEFLYLENHKTLKQLLTEDTYKDYELIHVNEMIYGDSGLLRYEDKPVVERFTTPVMPLDYKKTYHFPENCHIKSIVRGRLGDKIKWNATPHTPSCNLKCCDVLGNQCTSNSPFVIPYIHKVMWLRHYKTKTIEEFFTTKVRRGYPDGNKDFFKKNNWMDDFFKENEKTIEKLELAEQLEEEEKKRKYEGLISIVIPCYNQAKYVKETIASVKTSTFKDFCCVIVNDGSTDNSEEVILDAIKDDDRFLYFKTKNMGVAHARNFGIAQTDSKYILCLDSDDMITPSYIAEGVNFLEDYKEFNLFYGKAVFLYDNGTEKDWDIRPYSYKALLKGNMIYSSHIFKREDYNKTKGYDERMDGFEDWEFLVQLLDARSNVYKTENKVFYYRRHNDSRDHEVKNNRGKYLLYIYEKNKEKYHDNNLSVKVRE